MVRSTTSVKENQMRKMKTTMIYLILAMTVFSCSSQSEKVEKTGKIHFDVSADRSLTSSEYLYTYDELYWYYTYTSDVQELKEETPVWSAATDTTREQGLVDKSIDGFTYGMYTFSFFGYLDKEKKTLIYKGTAENVVISKSDTPCSVTVASVSEGSVSSGSATLTFKNLAKVDESILTVLALFKNTGSDETSEAIVKKTINDNVCALQFNSGPLSPGAYSLIMSCTYNGLKVSGINDLEDSYVYKNGKIVVSGDCECYVESTITLDAGEGEFSDGTKKKNFSTALGSANWPEVPKNGDEEFDGWSYTLDGTILTWTSGVLEPVPGQYTMSANWTTGSCTVTLDLNGGTLQDGTTTIAVKKGEIIGELPSPEKTGFRFCGWYVDNKEFSESEPITENLTLKAEWIQTFTIKFDGGTGGKTDAATVSVDSGSTFTPTQTAQPTNDTWYKFKGWSTTSGGQTISSIKVNNDIQLYAVYEDKYTTGDATSGQGGGKVIYVNTNETTDGWKYLEALRIGDGNGNAVWGYLYTQTNTQVAWGFGATDDEGIGKGKNACEELQSRANQSDRKVQSQQNSSSQYTITNYALALSGNTYNGKKDWWIPNNSEGALVISALGLGETAIFSTVFSNKTSTTYAPTIYYSNNDKSYYAGVIYCDGVAKLYVVRTF